MTARWLYSYGDSKSFIRGKKAPYRKTTLKPISKKIRAKAKVHKKKEALASGMSLKDYRRSLHIKG